MTAADRHIHAGLLRRKAEGFYSGAAHATQRGHDSKAERMFNRGVQLDASATAHEQAAIDAATDEWATDARMHDHAVG